MIHSVIREDGVKIESMTKEEIKSLVENKNTSENLITSLKELNLQKNLKLWLGNDTEYSDVLKDTNTLYLIKNDAYFVNIQNKMNEFENNSENFQTSLNEYKNYLIENYTEYTQKIQQLRDDCCKNPVQNSPYYYVELGIVPCHTPKTFELSESYWTTWGGNKRTITFDQRIYNVCKWTDLNLTIKVRAESFVSGQTITNFHITGDSITEGKDYILVECDPIELDGSRDGSGNYRIDVYVNYTFEGKF